VNKTRPILQPEKDNQVWSQLLDELGSLYEGRLEIVFPSELNRHYFSWFHGMEEAGFRRELQYSFEEFTKSLENPGLVFWFITADGEPQILVLGYSTLDEQKKSFYLDTFAVKPRGKGIGNVVIEFLIRWAQTKRYHSIVLDTEEWDEKGIPLQRFYAKHGFETVSTSEKGDLIMKRRL
jgi:ribosomal protein S18 acetylase RimI-like enzyme